jgi:hypothetical protein
VICIFNFEYIINCWTSVSNESYIVSIEILLEYIVDSEFSVLSLIIRTFGKPFKCLYHIDSNG